MERDAIWGKAVGFLLEDAGIRAGCQQRHGILQVLPRLPTVPLQPTDGRATAFPPASGHAAERTLAKPQPT